MEWQPCHSLGPRLPIPIVSNLLNLYFWPKFLYVHFTGCDITLHLQFKFPCHRRFLMQLFLKLMMMQSLVKYWGLYCKKCLWHTKFTLTRLARKPKAGHLVFRNLIYLFLTNKAMSKKFVEIKNKNQFWISEFNLNYFWQFKAN